MTYNDKIMRVCDYVQQNLDADLTLDSLSDVAALSKFHFHRMFSAYTGMNLFKFIQLCRLRRASFQLAFKKDRKVIDIALDAGFESPEAFARAFKRLAGQTPSQFRKSPEWVQWHTVFRFPMPTGDLKMDVQIVDFPETKVAKLMHEGDPDRVFESSAKFIEWRKTSGLSPFEKSKTFGVPHNDPYAVPPEDFRFELCGSEDRPIPDNPQGVVSGVIPGGRCAMIRYHGKHDHMDKPVYYLYREWLPENNEEVRDFPVFFHYHNCVSDVDECDLVTDIYLPLK